MSVYFFPCLLKRAAITRLWVEAGITTVRVRVQLAGDHGNRYNTNYHAHLVGVLSKLTTETGRSRRTGVDTNTGMFSMFVDRLAFNHSQYLQFRNYTVRFWTSRIIQMSLKQIVTVFTRLEHILKKIIQIPLRVVLTFFPQI